MAQDSASPAELVSACFLLLPWLLLGAALLTDTFSSLPACHTCSTRILEVAMSTCLYHRETCTCVFDADSYGHALTQATLAQLKQHWLSSSNTGSAHATLAEIRAVETARAQPVLMSQYVWRCVWLFWHETNGIELAGLCTEKLCMNLIKAQWQTCVLSASSGGG